MVNYQLGKIYKIYSPSHPEAKCYIGSTCEPYLKKRLSKHKSNYNYYQQGKRAYVSSFKYFEYDDITILLLESYPCKTKDELLWKEREWIEKSECVNMCKKPIATREEKNERKKQYIEENKDTLKLQKRKQYEENKENLLAKLKRYREMNKEKIKMKKLRKYDCACGGKYSHCQKARHIKSKKHQAWVESQENK